MEALCPFDEDRGESFETTAASSTSPPFDVSAAASFTIEVRDGCDGSVRDADFSFDLVGRDLDASRSKTLRINGFRATWYIQQDVK